MTATHKLQVAILAALGVGGVTPQVNADGALFTSVGPHFTYRISPEANRRFGLGGEMTFNLLFNKSYPVPMPYVGAAFAGTWFPRGGALLSFGAQGGMLGPGAEAGVTLFFPDVDRSPQVSGQLTPFLGAGLAWIGVRFTFPSAPRDEGGPAPTGVDLVWALKLPLPGNNDAQSVLPGGRPLIANKHPLVSAIARVDAWCS